MSGAKHRTGTESWQEFYRIYGKVVRDFAIRAGLTDSEADEVMNEASWRIKDQFKKRKKAGPGILATGADYSPAYSTDETTRTSMINRVPLRTLNSFSKPNTASISSPRRSMK